MNRKLFEIRNLERKSIIWLTGILLLLFSCFFIYQLKFNNEKNFLKFHEKSDYSPLTQIDKGFYGKVNSCLKKALLEKYNVEYDITKLDSVYGRLKFYYPTDTTDYLVSVDDIRLIDFVPDEKDKGELAFYFNSDFKNIIEKQRKNLTQKYFNIEWNRAKSKIVQITIDTTLFNLSLQNDNWKGTLKFKDPFVEVDSKVKYISTGKIVVPLFTSNVDSTLFYNSAIKKDWYEIEPLRTSTYSVDDYVNMYNSLNDINPENSQTINFNYPIKDDDREYSIRFLNQDKKIFIQTQNIDLEIFGSKKIIRFTHDATIQVNSSFDILKIDVTPRGHSKEPTIYISNISPFSIASKPLNEGVSGERLHIDTNYLDLFSLQQIRQIESGIGSKDSITHVDLSTNIILSKFLEQKIKETVSLLTKNKNFCQRPDDVFEMSVCLMDISTGEIIAAPFYSNEFEKNNIDEVVYQRNFNLARHDIGSTFKPLISYAAYLKYKSLSDFQLLPAYTDANEKGECEILGYKTIHYGFKKDKTKNPLFWSGSSVNRLEFLSQSHDNFPIALSMLALTEQNDPAYTFLISNKLNNTAINNLHQINGDTSSRILYMPSNERTKFKDISNSSFINIISNLYDVESENKDSTYNTITYDTHSWDNLKTHKKVFHSLYPDIVYLGTDRFGNIGSERNDFKKFEGFVLGQGDNLWTNVKLAEAYSRLLSKHKVTASFLQHNSSSFPSLFQDPHSLFQSESNKHYQFNVTTTDANNSWSDFMRDWRTAVQINTPTLLLKTAINNFQKGVLRNGDYYFYCKTGTPQENNEHENEKVFKKGKSQVWWDEGVFVFGVTNKDPNYPKGIVGVVYIKHLSLNKITKGVESSTARDFLQPDIFQKIMFFNQNRFKQ